MTLKLRADFVIEIEADDFVEAADHQRRLEKLWAAIRAEYEHARFSFNERRARSGAAARSGPRQLRTGNLHDYEDGED